ncbi:(2Fe-2S)-binding protein [Pseudomonas sp. YQ_13]|uniref:(2Fe-2S)-binding protein n=1 Tax=Pseudomonas sp. YQ_13 TaxID=3367235 RepID=UPI00370BE023
MQHDLTFKRLANEDRGTVQVEIDGAAFQARAGETVAAAVLAAGLVPSRATPLSGSPRAPYCMMGVCFECLLEVDGVPNVQGCMTLVAEGMKIRPQSGARKFSMAEQEPYS